MGCILFVDDDKFFGMPYVRNLHEHFENRHVVDVCSRIDDAIHYFHSHRELVAIVLDVMMPPPESTEYSASNIHELTENGSATGIWYLRLLRRQIIERQVRIFILTNRAIDLVQAAIPTLAFPAGMLEFDRKLAVPAVALPGRLAALLNRPIA